MSVTGGLTPTRILSVEARPPQARLGVAVVEGLVNVIVSGELKPGELLPPEGALAQQFGVSRTVLRESIKRVEEKGLLTVEQGRGTLVQPTSSWNILDRIVLTALISYDDSSGVLDEITSIRACLESTMAASAAQRRTTEQVGELRKAIDRMYAAVGSLEEFSAADVMFHELVMAFSGNRLAESMARLLSERARESRRFHGTASEQDLHEAVAEHEVVVVAIEAQDAEGAERAMKSLILDAWRRRRLPTSKEVEPGPMNLS